QREELADAWFGSAVFELGQPTIGNAKPLVAFGFGNSPARLLDLAHRDVASVAKELQLLTSRHGKPHLFGRHTAPTLLFTWATSDVSWAEFAGIRRKHREG